MIHAPLTKKDKRQIRYTYAKLETLKAVIAAVRLKMEMAALQMNDAYLKRSILTFVAETAPCETELKKKIESLAHVFPATDLNFVKKDLNDDLLFDNPFACAQYYEKETILAFRDLLNDYEIIPEIRNNLQAHLNEMLYAYLKIKLLNNFSIKELSGQRTLF
ncbi:hypothetical protein [Foetidibacter luteolus]|uniref:hypothetical protein n=1 Tax=Foetidibacter luteolus TaxID=2608880 RepID=UPI00129B9E46|nr:hypothetical protein [Foetidibacter luteolus]